MRSAKPRFAGGDQVITRVNDQRAEVFNRERWQIAEVEAGERRVVLEGIDQAKRVELDAEYLARTNPYNDAPALEHAYAVTTYSAQGSTVDQAFVAADPSMDKQELYVATSRSRGETHIYATPEIQAHREEIAPSSPYLREGIPHIAEAAERDRAQLAAHEVALRSRLDGLPTDELVARHSELRGAADNEARQQERRDALKERIERGYERLEQTTEAMQRASRQQLQRLEAELAQTPAPGDAARREFAVADQVLAERRQLAITAARVSPPTYIRAELGERPSNPTERKAWDRGVAQIESYRQRYGITDPNRALGREAKRSGRGASGVSPANRV